MRGVFKRAIVDFLLLILWIELGAKRATAIERAEWVAEFNPHSIVV
jgi:hypothetical protein